MTTQGPITIYNKRLGPDRRDVYYPTAISGASYAEKMGSTHADGQTDESLSYKLRIPWSARTTAGRSYVPEAVYRALDPKQAMGHWTIAQLDLVVRGMPLASGPVDERAIRDAAAKAAREVITVADYADNTGRGSPAVRHWRIGGR